MVLKELGQVVEGDGDVGVLLAEARLVDGERAAHQRLGLAEPVGGVQQRGQVVEAGGDLGMVGPEARLVDGQGPAHQRLGLTEPVGGLEQLGQIVEADSDVGMVGAETRLVDGQRSPNIPLCANVVGAPVEISRGPLKKVHSLPCPVALARRVVGSCNHVRQEIRALRPKLRVLGAIRAGKRIGHNAHRKRRQCP